MKTTILALCAACLWPAAALATTFTLWPDGSGDFPNIQAAVDAAADGDIIELGDGTFQGPGNRDIDCIEKALTIRSREGNPGSCIVDCVGDAGEEHRGFRFQDAVGDPPARLEGITVTRAFAGAIVVFGFTDTRILNCILTENRRAQGAAIVCVNWGRPMITDCILRGNAADRGGAVYCQGTSAVFTRCTFEGNSAAIQGGVIWSTEDANQYNPTFDDCMFRDNESPFHGGVLYCSDGSPSFNRCTFSANNGGIDGGAASLGAGASPEFSNCTFVGNRAIRDGSSVCAAYGASPVLHNSIIAFGFGASAVYCDGQSDAQLQCCDIYGNEGGDWVGSISDQYGVEGNLSADPLFCDPAHEDFTLDAQSPCSPGSNPECGLIGAWPVGCSATPAERTTWGRIKALYLQGR
jgi:hypothetical protein